jgi:hypothetical protein
MTIQDEIRAFEGMQRRLESESMGQWVVIKGGELIAVYDGFETAAADAVRRFGNEVFLIRQVGAPPITLPISVMYHRRDAHS